MKLIKLQLLATMVLLLSGLASFAQKTSNLIIANDHLVILIDKRAGNTQIDSILRLAGISEIKAADVIKGNFAPIKKYGWNVKYLGGNQLQLDRPLSLLSNNPQAAPFQITTTLRKTEERPGYPAEVAFGVNKFSRTSVFELPSGLTRFFLPGNQKAKRVILSGNFNDWSTMLGQMQKTDSGWVSDIKIEPGKYYYKFIVNGNWTTDPNNTIREDDGAGNSNSVYYRTNYVFKLNGYTNAGQVSISGNFNNWNEHNLQLQRTAAGWQLRLYLHDGTYAYRFIVDGRGIPDPLNPNTRHDESGERSVLNVGQPYVFKLSGYANAKQVYVAGQFNNWQKNELAMHREGNAWVLPYTISAGNYQYKFIVDDNWITDPKNPHTATQDGQVNSFVSVKANHTFHLKGYTNAHTVRLAGSFNNWDEYGYTMVRDTDGWSVSIYLKPGKHLYKFIADGNWLLDNTNKTWEPNQFGTGNSVLWVN